MDPVIWGNLPEELVRKILGHARKDMSIDTRRALGFRPRKIPESFAWKLWYLLNHDGLFYNLDTRALHNFRVPGVHMIRRPVEIAWLDDDLIIFNLQHELHTLEITTSNGVYLCQPNQTEPFTTECKVILKGGGVLPVMNGFRAATH